MTNGCGTGVLRRPIHHHVHLKTIVPSPSRQGGPVRVIEQHQHEFAAAKQPEASAGPVDFIECRHPVPPDIGPRNGDGDGLARMDQGGLAGGGVIGGDGRQEVRPGLKGRRAC